MTTPHPPAVVSTAVRGPRGRGWVANVAAASNASSTVVASVTPGLAAHAVEDPVVGREAAGVARGGALAARSRAALHEHDGLAARDRGEALEQRPAVGDAFDVREADRGRVVVGVPVEVVGDRRPRPRCRRSRPG